MKKKIIMLVLALVILVSGCSDNTKTSDVKNNDSKTLEDKKPDSNKEAEDNDNVKDKGEKNDTELNSYEVGSFKFSLPKEYILKKIDDNLYEANYKNESVFLQVTHSNNEKPLENKTEASEIRKGIIAGFKEPLFKKVEKYREVVVDGVRMGIQNFTSETDDGLRILEVAAIATKNEFISFTSATLTDTDDDFINLISELYHSIEIKDSEKFE